MRRASAGKSSRWQFSLRLLLLLMAAVGVWTAEIVNRREIPLLARRITAMRPIARELNIVDATKPAIVKREELWYDENEWDVYLPGDRFQLALATQDIDIGGLAEAIRRIQLPAGRFRLAILQDKTETGWRVRVMKDGEELLAVDEPAEWYPSHGSSGGGHFSVTQQPDPQQPIELFRRRFSRPINKTSSQTPKGPCEGVLLWIERNDDPSKK